MLEKFFKFEENGTNLRTELIAGITTFMTMVYILALNPAILSAAPGLENAGGSILFATAVASAIACFCMAAFANKPFALSAGLGLNAYFAYTVCGQFGYSWQVALTAVLAEGLIFIVMSLTNVREAIFNAIPKQLKTAVSVGIGLFITFIGLQNAHVIVDSSTLVGLYSFKAALNNGTFFTEGITVILALVGVIVTAMMLIKGIKGYMLYGILITWGLGIICELTGLYVPNAEMGFYSVLPTSFIAFPDMSVNMIFQFDFGFIASHFLDFVVVVFAFLFVDVFDTLGTLIGCAAKADMLDEEGNTLIGTCILGEQWSVLSFSEWLFLVDDLEKKGRASSAIVEGVEGIVLLPDFFTMPEGLVFYKAAYYDDDWNWVPKEGQNIYTAEEWQMMEVAGAVFLPATLKRLGSTVSIEETAYWTDTDGGFGGTGAVIDLDLEDGSIVADLEQMCIGNPVRLVYKVHD